MDAPAQALIADRYRLERELGRGGMATVWLAQDLPHDRPVAIKVLHAELAGAIGIDRFIREVRLAARLQHPNIVPILDSGILHPAEGPALPWYAMAFLEGESLRARLAREQQLPVDEALRITSAVADALQAAHRQGVVHRDIKPDNVFLSGGQVYVIDFGIAKALLDTGSEQLTSTGLAIGTPAYMSPEQSSAGRVDARSDQYSLATVLYEMLTGEPPFKGPTAQAIMARRLAEPARSIRTVRPTVPPALEDAVLQALERVPADRYPDVTSFIAALRGDRGTGAQARSHGVPRIALGAALVVIGVATWVFLKPSHGPAAHPVDPEVKALYDRGHRAYARRTPAGTVEAVADFNAAIRRDSAYTPAWTGLATAYIRAYNRYFVIAGIPRDSLLQRAVAAVDAALAADPGSAEAWTTRSEVSAAVDPTDRGPALRSVRQAITLDSMSAPAWHYLANYLAESGDFEGAMEAWRRCVRTGPSYTQGVAFLGLGHYWRRQYDSATVWADSAVELDPTYVLGRSTAGFVAVARGDFARGAAAFDAARRLTTDVEVVNALASGAMVEALAGRRQDAWAALRRAESLAVVYQPAPLHTAVYMAQAYAALGDTEGALAWLTRYQPRRDLHFQLHLRCDPPFDPIAGGPRFQALLIRPRPSAGQGC